MPLLRQERRTRQLLPGLGAGVFPADELAWALRPDLMLTGRTLMGHESPRTSSSRTTIRSYPDPRHRSYARPEYESSEPGIPVKTRHNEVAPNQFRAGARLRTRQSGQRPQPAADDDHGQNRPPPPFPCPAAREALLGINGSGKHNNWSLGTDTGVNPLLAGKTASESAIHHLSGERDLGGHAKTTDC